MRGERPMPFVGLLAAAPPDPFNVNNLIRGMDQTHFGRRPSGLGEAFKVLWPIIIGDSEQSSAGGQIQTRVMPMHLADP